MYVCTNLWLNDTLHKEHISQILMKPKHIPSICQSNTSTNTSSFLEGKGLKDTYHCLWPDSMHPKKSIIEYPNVHFFCITHTGRVTLQITISFNNVISLYLLKAESVVNPISPPRSHHVRNMHVSTAPIICYGDIFRQWGCVRAVLLLFM